MTGRRDDRSGAELEVVGALLVAAALILLVAAVIGPFTFPGGSLSERLELASQEADAVTAFLALAGATGVVVGRRMRGGSGGGAVSDVVISLAVAVAIAVFAGTGYSIWDLIAVNIPPLGATGQSFSVAPAVPVAALVTRVSGVLQRGGASVVGVGILCVARSYRRTMPN